MKVNIHKGASMLMLVLFFGAMASCGSKTDKKTKSETATGEVKKEHHEEETPTIATLTETQIKTAGIQLGKVEYKELTSTFKANGMLRVPNNNKANATALFGGVIKNIHVQIGDHVRKGQVIATISNPGFIQLQEEYLSIKSRITFAEQELQRQKELYAGNAGTLKNLQNATAEFNTLRTRKASLQHQIQLMGISPDDLSNNSLKSVLVVTSPLNGTVSNVFAKIGSYVDVSSPVAEIVDNRSLHLDLQVFEKDLPRLKIGQIIHFTLTNNPVTEYDAKIFGIGSSFENENKTIAVHAYVTGNKKGLIDGMNITGIVSLDNVTTPAVPDEAIVNADGRYYIFMVTNKADGHVHDEGGKDLRPAIEEDTEGYPRQKEQSRNFEKIEVLKGISEIGYTAVTIIPNIPADAQIVTKGAYFINAKLTNTGNHEH